MGITRDQKRQTFERFRLFFLPSCTDRQRNTAKRLLQSAVAQPDCRAKHTMKLGDCGRSWVDLHWGPGVGYDWAKTWIGKKTFLEQGKWEVQACADADATAQPMEASHVGEDAGATAKPTAASHVVEVRGATAEPTAASTVDEEAGAAAKPAAASSASGSAPTSPGLCLIKLLALLRNEPSKEMRDRFVSTYSFAVGNDTKQLLGAGSYGKVVAGKELLGEQRDVAIKIFDNVRQQDALEEVAAYAAAPPHPRLLRLLDVGVDASSVFLVFPKCRSSLRDFAKGRHLANEELYHLVHSIAEGVQHLHHHDLSHGDLKPRNVLIHGVGLEDATAETLAQRLLHLPTTLTVVLGDLGLVQAADPRHRTPPTADAVENNGIELATLGYRAPEVILGDRAYGRPIDLWALGVIATELSNKPAPQGSSPEGIVSATEAYVAGLPDALRLDKATSTYVSPHLGRKYFSRRQRMSLAELGGRERWQAVWREMSERWQPVWRESAGWRSEVFFKEARCGKDAWPGGASVRA